MARNSRARDLSGSPSLQPEQPELAEPTEERDPAALGRQICLRLLTLAPRDVAQARANQMHDTGLDGRFREDRFDRVGEPFEPVDAADQDV